MSQAKSILDLTVTAAGAVARGRAVTFAGAQVTTAGAKPLGIAKQAAAAAGDDINIAVCGTCIAEAGAAITVGASLALDASGRVVTASALSIAAGGTPVTSTAANGSAIFAGGDPPQFVVGDALQAAAGAGAFIEILLRR